MRINIFLLFILTILSIYLWTTLSGALFWLGVFSISFLLIITVGYADICILFLLGAREVKADDEKHFFEAASQEAYKLAVNMPLLYYYNGSLERGFILQNGPNTSIVLSRTLLDSLKSEELSALCFEMLLQVKKGMAPKRTKVMFILGSIFWILHSFISLLLSLVPFKEVKQSSSWFLSYLLHPWLDFLFRLTLGTKYFKKIQTHMHQFPKEQALLERVGLKLRLPQQLQSLPSKKILELTSLNRSRHLRNILALEVLPHEWDYFFKNDGLNAE